MKRFLACVATAIAICIPLGLAQADEESSTGRVRLSEDPAPPPPVPHVIGSDMESGQVIMNDGGPYAAPYLPEQSGMYQEYIGAGSFAPGVRTPDNYYAVQYRLNRQFGGLYGYDGGYTDIGMFIPRIIDEDSIFFFDMRGFVTDDQDGGFNLGLGRRHYNAYNDRVWSNGLWLDYDGGHVEDYLRVGYSGSMTSRFWRYRWNGYWVANENNHIINTQLGSNPYYQGSSIAVDRLRTREVAYSGADFTVGGPIPLLGQFGLNWDFGVMYNYGDGGKDGFGFLARADSQITEDIALGVSYSDDAVFGSNAQMTLAINFPDGRHSSFLRQPRVHDYMLRSDVRNYRVSTQRFQLEDSVDILTECGLPYSVAHIDPSEVDGVAPAGDGTIDNPFNSLAAWEALSDAEKAQYGIILVRPGTDVTTPDGVYHANLNTGITIGESQRLLATSGRLVRNVDDEGVEQIVFADHQFTGYVAGLGDLVFDLPSIEDDSLAGTVWEPGGVYDRPILSNHELAALPDAPHAVVTISNEFSAICEATPTEVSGFEIDGYNPNLPLMYNNGIVSGNYADPIADRGITSFDVNSNFIYDATHGINLVSVVDGTGYVDSTGAASGNVSLNQIEGAGFYSNSGINIDHLTGTLNLNVSDNIVYNVMGEDINNDGLLTTIPGGLPTEDGITNLNGKLDIGEDTNGDGLISANEDNDLDGVLGADDLGIGIRVAADGPAAIINASNSIVKQGSGILTTGTISRNQTYMEESVLGRDINGDIAIANFTNIIDVSDTDDIVGNKNGMSLEALNGGLFVAKVEDNDTSYNNPYQDGLLPPLKNPYLNVAPTPLGDEFGFRALSQGAGSQMYLSSPTNHKSNFNFGHGATFEGRDGGVLATLTPIMGSYTVDDTTGEVTATPSEYNDNGLNGLRIYGDNNSSLAIQVGDPSSDLNHTLSDPFDEETRTYYASNQFLRNGQDGDVDTSGHGIEVYLRSGATFANGFTSGIFHNTITDNSDNGILIDVEGTTLDNFVVYDNIISGNLSNGIYVSGENTPIANLIIQDNQINNNGLNGINFQLESSTLTNPIIEGNLINGNGNLMAVNPVSLFDIEVVFLGGLTASQQAIFQQAADRWAELIVGDLPDVGGIDDVRITAEGVAIDGVNGILGQAGPTAIRDDTNLPYQGLMEFDSADLAALEDSGQLYDVILHEMGHVLGIGTIWQLNGLLPNPSNGDGVTDTRFTGTAAITEYNDIFVNTDTGVPVENTGGPGTADGHWRESIFNNELMTGYLNAGQNPISRITTASLQDLGYLVNMNASDAYTPSVSTPTTINMTTAFEDYSGAVQTANATANISNLVQIDPTATGNGINFSVNNSNLENVLIENNLINENTGDGIRMLNPQFASNGPAVNEVIISLNQINNNTGYGVNIALDNDNRLDTVICVNDISGNGMGGINVELSDNAYYDNGTFDSIPGFNPGNSFSGNTINNNGGIGYHITAANNAQFELIGSSPLHTTVNGNQDAGIAVEMSGNTVGTIELDNITINGNQDDDFGTPEDSHTILNGDGFALLMNNNARVTDLRIGDSDNVDPAFTSLSNNIGNGINIRLNGTARLDKSEGAPVVGPGIAASHGATIQNSVISGNGGTYTSADTNSDGIIDRYTGASNIHIERNGAAVIDDVLITRNEINDAVLAPLPPVDNPLAVPPQEPPTRAADAIVNRGGDGINIFAGPAELNDEYDILLNDISGNANNGIWLSSAGSGQLDVDIQFNRINENGTDGIQTTQIQNNIFENNALTGQWIGNEIVGNGRHGINVNTQYGRNTINTAPLVIGQLGTTTIDGVDFNNGNTIAENGQDGIHFGFTNGTAIIQNNYVADNGRDGMYFTTAFFQHNVTILDNLIEYNDRHGINIVNDANQNDAEGIYNVGGSIPVYNLGGNLIQYNDRDGVQILSSAGEASSNWTVPGSSFVTVNFLNSADSILAGGTGDTNIIYQNQGRGIDLLVRGSGRADVSIDTVLVDGNGEEGIYGVITSDVDQSNEVSATADLLQEGNIFSTPFLDLAIRNSTVTNNGALGGYEGGGIVLRVGTTGAWPTAGNAGGTWINADDAILLDPTVFGGLQLAMTDNETRNNFGVDLWMHTFVSTRDPIQTVGTWTDQNTAVRDNTNDVFDIDAYEQDPLARIYITEFNGNTGGSVDLFGRIADGNSGTGSNQNYAFYNNNESVFKSRRNTGSGVAGTDTTTDGGPQDDFGPFTSGTRPRNATRLASRTGFTTYETDAMGTTRIAGGQLPPTLTIIDEGNSDNFPYSGLGLSTLRVASGADLDLTGLFDTVFSDFTDEVGFSQGNGLNVGRNTSYLWDVVP